MMFIAALLALFAPAAETPRPQCTGVNSVQTTIVEIQREPDRFLDRCVTVSGLFSSIRLYASRDAIYLIQRFGSDGNWIPANLQHRIGVDKQEMRALQLRTPRRATVTGRVDSCERRTQRIVDAGGIPFLAGYCHYENGPTIVVDQYRLFDDRFERLTGEVARLRFGNLALVPEDWPHRAELESFAMDFLSALRSRDRTRMAELHGMRPGRSGNDDQAVLTMLIDDANSPFADLRRLASPQIAIFSYMRGDAPVANEHISGIVCFCRAANCSDRWPIAGLDADNAPDRPYVCTRVEPRNWLPRRAGLSTALSRPGFLAEPMATAFRR